MISDIDMGLRTDISGPLVFQGRAWTDKPSEQRDTVRANYRRIRCERGKYLLRRRDEVVERCFAHVCETGGARRTWLHSLTKVTKRYRQQSAAHNLARCS